MLGIAEFYKSSPKTMPKTKRAPTEVASAIVTKKRMTRSSFALLDQNGTSINVKVENETKKPGRVRSVKKEKRVDIMKKKEEEEVEQLLGKQGSDDDNSDSDESVDYEKRRLQNIQENKRFFESLGILKTKSTLSTPAQQKTAVVRGLKREKKPPVVIPRRAPSLRIRRLDPSGASLPDLPEQPTLDWVEGSDSYRHARKPSGPLEMKPTNSGTEVNGELSFPLIETVSQLSKSTSPSDRVVSKDLLALTKTLQGLKLAPEHLAKVTKDRIFSVAVHPSETKVIACAGDKWGRIGVWDVDSHDGDDGVYLFEPHSRPVSCLKFAPSNPSKLYSCSYDGTIRCGDFQKGKFDEVYTTDVNEDIYCSHFDFLSPDGSKLLVSQNYCRQGHVQINDSRLRCLTSQEGYFLQTRSIKTVHVNPANSNHFITAASDGTVALWDLRNLKQKGLCKSISSMSFHRSTSSAYFSPVTGRKIIATSLDDKIRFLTVAESGKMEVQTSISHDNHTGRWLSNFRSVWYPGREDAVIIGSMLRPRRIQVYGEGGTLLHTLMDEESLGSVCSINACHPTRDIIVGGNSSGKLHVFM
ncbi:WD repeat-containing protein 76-like isoform X1 [Asterias amurensis]|uniref:WD repeat-containing protein 76-like isoform X1 n=1 Tax=Asterias amurensis TaxID=7602 RepID=UPI003AB3A523